MGSYDEGGPVPDCSFGVHHGLVVNRWGICGYGSIPVLSSEGGSATVFV